jgi:hypothetical protein
VQEFLDQLNMKAVIGLVIVSGIFLASMIGVLSKLFKSGDTHTRE